MRPLPPLPKPSPLPYVGIIVGLTALALGLAWWAPWQPHLAPPMVPTIPVTPLPSVAPSPAANVPSPAANKATNGSGSGPTPPDKTPGSKPSAGAVAKEAGADKAMEKPAAAPAAAKPATIAPAAGRVEKSPVQGSPQAQAEGEYRRAMGLLAQGNRGEAEAALQQALRLAPEHASARQSLFVLLVEQQRKDEARQLLATGLDILPGHSAWAMNIARLQMEKGDAAAAWETLQRSLAGAQNNGEYRAFCGTVLQRLGRGREAIEHFHAALRLNPGEGRWWLGLALVLEAESHPAEAREAYARAKAAGNLPADLAAFAEQKSRP
ncbi:hypothetical protein DLREEDagrD3_28350 [Denitratisoma sp. agr-D3]